MKKVLLTESQMRLITEEITRNDLIQRLLFTEPSGIDFNISDEFPDVETSILRLTPLIGGTEIGDDFVKMLCCKNTINGHDVFEPYINVNDNIRELGIGSKICDAAIEHDYPLYFNNEDILDNEPLHGLVDKLKGSGKYHVEVEYDDNGNEVGVTISKNRGFDEISDDEKQYVDTLLESYFNNGVLNEGTFDLTRFTQFLFRGCTTFKDYASRIMHIAQTGTIIALSIYIAILKQVPTGTEQEKEQLLQQVEQTIDSKQTNSNDRQYAQSFSPSQNCIKHLMEYEKLRLEPYYATKQEQMQGKRTIGYGHVIKNSDPSWLKTAKSITQEQAEALFDKDVRMFEGEFNNCIRLLPKPLRNPQLYTQGWIDAAFSIMFNSGNGNFRKSKFFEAWSKCRIDKNTGKINAEDYNYTASLIKRSCIVQDGKVCQGLVNRRNTESLMAQMH